MLFATINSLIKVAKLKSNSRPNFGENIVIFQQIIPTSTSQEPEKEMFLEEQFLQQNTIFGWKCLSLLGSGHRSISVARVVSGIKSVINNMIPVSSNELFIEARLFTCLLHPQFNEITNDLVWLEGDLWLT